MSLREHAYARLPLLALQAGELTEEQRAELDRPLVGTAEENGVIDPDVLWSCTNCGACVQECPVDIEHIDHIDNVRRHQVLVESEFPSELNRVFTGMERKGNPWGMNAKDRMVWAKDLPGSPDSPGRPVRAPCRERPRRSTSTTTGGSSARSSAG